MNRNSNSSCRQGAATSHSRMSRGAIALLLAGSLLAAVPAGARNPEILAFGDSLTSGYGLPPDESFPALDPLNESARQIQLSVRVEF